jgi:hypothetical protein
MAEGERLQEVFPVNEGEVNLITTYEGTNPPDREDPLPSFTGSPKKMEVSGTAAEIAASVWDVLNPDFKVSLASIVFNMPGEAEVCILNKNY